MEYEQELHDKTFKDSLDIAARTFYTLRQVPELQTEANSRLLGLLVKHLTDRGLITEAELDHLLLKAIQ